MVVNCQNSLDNWVFETLAPTDNIQCTADYGM